MTPTEQAADRVKALVKQLRRIDASYTPQAVARAANEAADALTALQARVGELEAGVRAIVEMTDPDDPDSYRADDREGCLDAVHARAALLTPPLEQDR